MSTVEPLRTQIHEKKVVLLLFHVLKLFNILPFLCIKPDRPQADSQATHAEAGVLCEAMQVGFLGK